MCENQHRHDNSSMGFVEEAKAYLSFGNVINPIINLPFGDSLYLPSMVILVTISTFVFVAPRFQDISGG